MQQTQQNALCQLPCPANLWKNTHPLFCAGHQAQVEQWIDFSTLELDAPLLSWFLPLAGFLEYNKKVLVSAAHSVLARHAQLAARPAADA